MKCVQYPVRVRMTQSHPSRGAWIEITGTPPISCAGRRTPHGVRGLKSCRPQQHHAFAVAPLTGCVD